MSHATCNTSEIKAIIFHLNISRRKIVLVEYIYLCLYGISQYISGWKSLFRKTWGFLNRFMRTVAWKNGSALPDPEI